MSELQHPTATSSLTTWLSYLESIHTSAIDLGLERVAAVADRAQLTKPAPTVITVAGTNGKGTTCALLESILRHAGYRTGVYSSPHLIHYNERVRINGKWLDDAAHSKAFATIEKVRGETSLSFFEFGTLAALQLFKQHALDVVILEVGLGGRLDATNVVEHDVSVITSLALDHCDWLGDDINQIGYEKAGIFRADKPAVCGQPFPPASVAAHADSIGAELHQLGYQYHYTLTDDTWCWAAGAFELTALPIPAIPLQNAATALMALGVADLEIADTHISDGLASVSVPGRMQVVAKAPYTVFDVAHNPHAAAYLAEKLAECKAERGGHVHAVVAMLSDKDMAGTLACLDGIVDHWYPASLSVPRGAPADSLPVSASQQFASPSEAYQHALKHAEPARDCVVVFGSFHTVGQVMSELN
ncbi:bifunctional tetrahydrofolate synthase/dihydrofolate synthase [Salinivibrio sp. ML198]|uniref:bifunctional tetrahydrofolate synthase/dihydrofolate synthase n=1 Tax=Salinivibrio sp. ML198 TaxID=1909458 RepID=UPI0009896D80|nr:bifunctional tetrahydrofolate synthase/dihydrofolate synthase [Salinivibrio sp. ML198]OOE79828.1 bifunctional tetrahydrofolate synthase/dihydrofolate synthase [Salinivibrio sp. ML198]